MVKMSSLVLATVEDEYVITLKEITDLLGIEHSKAKKTVEELALEEGFGWLAKTATQYKSGKGRTSTLQTYKFTQLQAIAVGARLNNKMLMKVVVKLKELELSKNMLSAEMQKHIEQFLPKGGFLEENSKGGLKTKAIRGYYRFDSFSEETILLNRKYQLQKRLNGLMMEDYEIEIKMVDMEIERLRLENGKL